MHRRMQYARTNLARTIACSTLAGLAPALPPREPFAQPPATLPPRTPPASLAPFGAPLRAPGPPTAASGDDATNATAYERVDDHPAERAEPGVHQFRQRRIEDSRAGLRTVWAVRLLLVDLTFLVL